MPVTARLIRSYLAEREPAAGGPIREALRWFYEAARRHLSAPGAPVQVAGGSPVSSRSWPLDQLLSRPSVRNDASRLPPPAQSDLGGPDWERALIKALREKGFLWRTEETYRG